MDNRKQIFLNPLFCLFKHNCRELTFRLGESAFIIGNVNTNLGKLQLVKVLPRMVTFLITITKDLEINEVWCIPIPDPLQIFKLLNRVALHNHQSNSKVLLVFIILLPSIVGLCSINIWINWQFTARSSVASVFRMWKALSTEK